MSPGASGPGASSLTLLPWHRAPPIAKPRGIFESKMDGVVDRR